MTTTTTTIATLEIRELTREELEAIQGAWVANAIGGVVGAVSGGVSSYITSGGDWRATATGAIGGGVAGIISPISSVRSAAQAIGAGALSGAGTALAEKAWPAAQPAPAGQ